MVILDMCSYFLADSYWLNNDRVTLSCSTRTLYTGPCSLTPLKDSFGFLVVCFSFDFFFNF